MVQKQFLKHFTTSILILFFISPIMIWERPVLSAGSADAVAGDPIGDNFGTLPSHDITQLYLYTESSHLLEITIRFDQAIGPPDSGAAYAVVGFIDIDIDQNASTGNTSHLASYPQCGDPGLGVDYFIDLYQYTPG